MSIGIAGSTSTVAAAFAKELLASEIFPLRDVPLDRDRYLICTGFLAGKAIGDLSPAELMDTFTRNFAEIAILCDHVLATRPTARICVIGSESGISGSFDMAYAGAKAALNLYIETKKLEHAEQMIVGIAPHIIWDSNMTAARDDLDQLNTRARGNRLGRWLKAKEVAELARFLLMDASPSLSGQVIRMRCT